MTTLARLLDSLSRVYDTTPGAVLGLRLSYLSGSMKWTIANDTLTTTVVGGNGGPLSVDLTPHTLSTLSVYLASQPGYVVPYLIGDGLSATSALALVPGSGDISTSNGDWLLLALNPNWTYLAAVGNELTIAQTQISLLPAEMATTTADGEWLDFLGSFYAVPRQIGESDGQYGLRIPAEVILPRQNNVAIAVALQTAIGQIATCTDAPIFGKPSPAYDGAINFSGAPHFYNATAKIIYNLFDVTIGYDLLGSYSPADFLVSVRGQIDRLRAAGTHLRNLTLTASIMGDTVPTPSDSLTEGLTVRNLMGLGSSANSALGQGLFPVLLVPLSFSANSGLAALTTGSTLAGTGQSVDRVAAPILVGANDLMPVLYGFSDATPGAFSFNSGIADLSTGTVRALQGIGVGINTAFVYLGGAFIAQGLGASANGGQASLRTGANVIATSLSRNSGSGTL